MLKYSMLLINNSRSKAYLQNLIKNGYLPEKIIVLNDMNANLVEHTENDKIISKDTKQSFFREIEELDICFDEKEHILTTIENNNIDYIVLNTLNINSAEVVREVSNLPTEYIIYSGPGGTILRHEILNQGKQFVHVHPGWLPKYRGSTTIYYSMLLEKSVGASVILFEEGIDEGPILYKQEYKIVQKGIDFDYTLDPLVRTKTLLEFFQKGEVLLENQKKEESSSTFYIIHPFLKHASILNYNK